MIVDYNDLEVCQIELTTECGAGCPQCPRNVYGGKTVEDLPICELSLDDIKNIFPIELVKRLRLVFFCGTIFLISSNDNSHIGKSSTVLPP